MNPECINAYNLLKNNRTYKYIIYKLSDDSNEVVVEDASESPNYDEFRDKLINATTTLSNVRMMLWSFGRSERIADVLFLSIFVCVGFPGKGPSLCCLRF